MYSARYRYRFYPTTEQRHALARQFGCCRYVYNWALALKRDAFNERGEKVSYAKTDKALTALKREADTSWLKEVSSVPLQQALRHLDKAYTAFFQGVAKYPRFKAKRHRQTATYTLRGFSLKDSGVEGEPLVKLAKTTTPLRIRWGSGRSFRPLPSAPSSVTVILEPDGRYYISFVVKSNPQPAAKTKRKVGIDLGLTDVVVSADDLGRVWHSGNPKHLRTAQARLAREQRRLAKKQKGSSNWHKQRRKVARLHARISAQREDFLHQMTTRLVRRYDVICVESLNVKGMVKNHTLARAIHGASWSKLVSMLRYKCQWYGKELVEIDRFFPSSKTCSSCSHVCETLPLSVRGWSCPSCGSAHHRDVNAATNILGVGQTLLACGQHVSPALAQVSGGGAG